MRLRVVFSKSGPLTYTSHLDLMRIWERSLRRAGAPLAYSQGFNPRPKLQLADALPLGHTGEAEFLDVWLDLDESAEACPGQGRREQGRWGAEQLATALAPVLPYGLGVHDVRAVDLHEPALQTQVVSAVYLVAVEWRGPAEELAARIARVLGAETLMQEKRDKQYDLRPLIEGLWLAEVDGDEAVVGMQLAARAGATARPEAVLEAMGLDGVHACYRRQRLLMRCGAPGGGASSVDASSADAGEEIA